MKNAKKYGLLVYMNFEELVAGIAMVVCVVATVLGVIFRYVLGSSLPGASDVSVLGFTWAVFIGMSGAYKRRMHYGVEILDLLLGSLSKRIKALLCHLIELVGFVLCVYLSWLLVQKTLISGRVSAYLELNYVYYYYPILAGFIFMVIHNIRFIYMDIRALKDETYLEKVKVKQEAYDLQVLANEKATGKEEQV